METILLEKSAFDKMMQKIDEVHQKLIEGKNASTQSEWMDPEETLFLLKCSARSLQTYRDSKLLEFSRLSKKKIFYKRSSVLALLESKLNSNKA